MRVVPKSILPFIPQNIEISDNLKNFYHFLQNEVKPNADLIDKDTQQLIQIVNKMASFNVLGIDVPIQLGGLSLDIIQRHYFMRNIVRASGALSLLQRQHQAALKTLATSNNKIVQHKYLAKGLSGEIGIGISYSHLRNGVNNPPVRGQLSQQGYIVNGICRFVTGCNIFQYLAIGFVNEIGEEIIAIVPFQNNPNMKLKEVIDLPAGKSTLTISIELNNLIVPHDTIVIIKPKGTFYQNSLTRFNLESIHAGTALAILDLIATSPRINEPFIYDFYAVLMASVANYEQSVISRKPDQLVAVVRAKGIHLVNQCLLFAQQVFRGIGANTKHSLYRLQNEALLESSIGADDHLIRELIKIMQ